MQKFTKNVKEFKLFKYTSYLTEGFAGVVVTGMQIQALGLEFELSAKENLQCL